MLPFVDSYELKYKKMNQNNIAKADVGKKFQRGGKACDLRFSVSNEFTKNPQKTMLYQNEAYLET